MKIKSQEILKTKQAEIAELQHHVQKIGEKAKHQALDQYEDLYEDCDTECLAKCRNSNLVEFVACADECDCVENDIVDIEFEKDD